MCRQFAIGEDDHPFSSAMGNGVSKEKKLVEAAKTGDLESVRALLNDNTNANYRDEEVRLITLAL